MQVGVPINLAALYDDIGDAYPWVIKLPVQVCSQGLRPSTSAFRVQASHTLQVHSASFQAA